MSERKVLNKYYPPDFDPSKIPRMKLPRNRQYTVRLMAPFNMRCKTCGEYIYKGKKFNARKEDVEGEDYLGIRIYRFYIKCTRCLQEISFKTDPKNTDYEIEAGATRNFMALKLAEEQAQREEDEKKEEEASNPMKLLENRTEQSKQELELLESLEELKDLNKRQRSIDFDAMLSQFDTREARERILKMQEEDDERLIRSVFSKKIVGEEVIEEIEESYVKKSTLFTEPDEGHYQKDDVSRIVIRDQDKPPPDKLAKISSSVYKSASSTSSTNKSNLIVTKAVPLKVNNETTWSKSVGIMSHKSGSGGLAGLVRIKSDGNQSKRTEEQSLNILPKIETGNNNSVSVNQKGGSNESSSGIRGCISLVGNYGSSSSDSE